MSFNNYITLLKLTKQRAPIQMICYKDRAWCNEQCANTACDRNFTEEERKRAIEWWGDEDFPICLSFFRTADCGFIPEEIHGELTDG